MNSASCQLEFTPEQAFVALAIATVTVDGEYSDEEDMAVTQAILSADLFATYPPDQLIMMINNSFNCIQEKGVESILKSAIAQLPETLYSEALTAVAQIIMADGKVSSEEQNLLNHLGQAFALSEEEITKTLELQKI